MMTAFLIPSQFQSQSQSQLVAQVGQAQNLSPVIVDCLRCQLVEYSLFDQPTDAERRLLQ